MLSLIPVKRKSSTIEALHHSGETLHVLFLSGALYRYDGVPYVEYEQLKNADTIGGYFAAAIRSTYQGVEVKVPYRIGHPLDVQRLRELLPGPSFGF